MNHKITIYLDGVLYDRINAIKEKKSWNRSMVFRELLSGNQEIFQMIQSDVDPTRDKVFK